MCCTCDANRLVEAASMRKTVVFTWEDTSGVSLKVEVKGKEPEGPAQVRLRTKGIWQPWFSTKDLAGTMMAIGTDVKWEYVSPVIQNWLTGRTEYNDGARQRLHGR